MLVNPKGFFPRFLAAAQVELNPQKRVVQLVAPESAGYRQCNKTKPILVGGELCLEEMVRAHMDKDREPAGAWGVVEVGVGWVETAQVQVPQEIAYVLAVERRYRIRQVFPAMI